MPNHILNVLKANEKVLNHLLNDEKQVDFNNIIKCNVPNSFNGYFVLSENLARKELYLPTTIDLKINGVNDILKSEILEQKDKMIENYRASGYLHDSDFATRKWGTKWNAYDTSVTSDSIQFQTAWEAPLPVIFKLSQLFPNETIDFTYSSEDYGYNCKHLTILNGLILTERALTFKECLDLRNIDYEEYLRELSTHVQFTYPDHNRVEVYELSKEQEIVREDSNFGVFSTREYGTIDANGEFVKCLDK